MSANNLDFHTFDTHLAADNAIRALTHAKFDMTKLSLVGKGYHTEENPVGFYKLGDKVKAWGAIGALWGGVWGAFMTPAIFLLPGIGLVAMAGPLVAMLVSALEGAVVVGGLSALGVALLNSGLSKEEVIRYETALKSDEYVLIVHGTEEDIRVARALIGNRQQAA